MSRVHRGAVWDAAPDPRFQLVRLGYFCVDADSAPGALVFNRTVTLRGMWAGTPHAATLPRYDSRSPALRGTVERTARGARYERGRQQHVGARLRACLRRRQAPEE
jgi:hypothetical protein